MYVHVFAYANLNLTTGIQGEGKRMKGRERMEKITNNNVEEHSFKINNNNNDTQYKDVTTAQIFQYI